MAFRMTRMDGKDQTGAVMQLDDSNDVLVHSRHTLMHIRGEKTTEIFGKQKSS